MEYESTKKSREEFLRRSMMLLKYLEIKQLDKKRRRVQEKHAPQLKYTVCHEFNGSDLQLQSFIKTKLISYIFSRMN